jgi:hypothetical protein
LVVYREVKGPAVINLGVESLCQRYSVDVR